MREKERERCSCGDTREKKRFGAKTDTETQISGRGVLCGPARTRRVKLRSEGGYERDVVRRRRRQIRYKSGSERALCVCARMSERQGWNRRCLHAEMTGRARANAAGRVWLDMYFPNGERKHSTVVPLIGRAVLIHERIDNRDELAVAATRRTTTAATATTATVAAVAAAVAAAAAAVVAAAEGEEEEAEAE